MYDQRCFTKTSVSPLVFNVGGSSSALLVANEPLYMPTTLKPQQMAQVTHTDVIFSCFRAILEFPINFLQLIDS